MISILFLAGLLLPAPSARGADSPLPNIIFISIDTLRPDHVGSYGYPKDTTPNLDFFAKDAVLFENAISAAPWTLPSHLSMFTSLTPHRHGVTRYPKWFSLRANLRVAKRAWSTEGWRGLIARFIKQPLIRPYRFRKRVRTLAQTLTDHGYRCAGFTAADTLKGNFGVSRGFAVYENAPFRPGPEQNRRALDWLRRTRSRPFFLFLHYYDAHGNYGRDIHDPVKMGRYPMYEAPEPHASLFDDGVRGRFDGSIAALFSMHRNTSFAPVDIRTLNALYDGGVHYADHSLGRFLSALKDMGLYEESIILITSDHGEELLRAHGGILHNYGLYNTLLRVLFVLKLPNGLLAGRRVPGLVRTIDYMPTILEAAGIPADPHLLGQMQGIPLLASIRRGRIPALEAYSEANATGFSSPMRALQDSTGWKLIYHSDSNETELYNLRKDPDEQRNLVDRRPDQAGRLLESLLEHSGLLDTGSDR